MHQIAPCTFQAVSKATVCCMGFDNSNLRECMNLRYPLLDLPLQKGVKEIFISNRRSKVLVAACGKVYSVGSKQFLCHLVTSHVLPALG